MKAQYTLPLICLIVFFIYLMSCEKWDYEKKDFFSVKIEVIDKNKISEYFIRSRLSNLDTEKIEVLQLGHCWSSSNQLPDLSDSYSLLLSNSIHQNNTFNDTIRETEFSTTYFVRAYIISNSNDIRDTVYSEETQFIQTDNIIITTDENIEIIQDSIIVRGLARIPNRKDVIAFYGHCWSLDPNPEFNPTGKDCSIQIPEINDDVLLFKSQIGPTEKNRTYYIRSYAIVNNDPPVYGNIVSYTDTSRWKQLHNMPAEPRAWTFSFVIDDLAYVGTGHARNFDLFDRTIFGCYDDFWVYNARKDEWTSLGKFPGGERAGTVSITTNNKAYVGLGFSCEADPFTNKLEHFNDFYAFDPTNGWERLPDFPGEPRSMATGFAIDDTLYVGTGRVADITSYFTTDFWKYSIAEREWYQMNPFPGSPKNGSYGFALNGKGYVAGGDDEGATNILEYHSTKETFEYNPVTGKWSQSPYDLPYGLSFGSVVSMQTLNKAYIVSGILNDIITLDQILEFDLARGWYPVGKIEAGVRGLSTAFGWDNKIFLTTGASLEIAGILSGQVVFLNDLWVFNL